MRSAISRHPVDPDWSKVRGLARRDDITFIELSEGDRNNGVDGNGALLEYVIGDLSTATRVIIWVPGTDSGISEASGFKDAKRIFDEGGDSNVAVVVYGYDTPDSPNEAVFNTDAKRAGSGLVRLVDKLKTHTSAPISVVAHSYGTLVVGNAFACNGDNHCGSGVERAAIVASPGMGFASRRDLNIPFVSVWMSDDDPIRWAGGHFTEDPRNWDDRRNGVDTISCNPGSIGGHARYFRDAGSRAAIVGSALGRQGC